MRVPKKYVIPKQLIVSAKSWAKVRALVKKPRKRNKALRDLLSGKPVPGEPKDW